MHFDAKVRHRSLDRLHAVDDRRGAAGRLHSTAAKTKKAHFDYLLIHLLRPVFQSRLQSRLGDLEQSTASNCWSEISEIRMKFDRESQLEEAHNSIAALLHQAIQKANHWNSSNIYQKFVQK